jgi:hypothetical protein
MALYFSARPGRDDANSKGCMLTRGRPGRYPVDALPVLLSGSLVAANDRRELMAAHDWFMNDTGHARGAEIDIVTN